jgi:hypothetical protein
MIIINVIIIVIIGDYELPDGARLTLDILDTSGAYQFPAMRELSISTADAFLLVFCVDREDTWDQIKHFKEQVNLKTDILNRTIIW